MKITVMGAGSTVFTKNVLGDVMLTPALRECEIALYDIDGYYDKLEEFMDYSMQEGFINKVCKEIYACAGTPEEVIHYIENDKPVKRSIRDLKNG